MLVNDFINIVKSERRYGSPATIVGGQVTAGDITDKATSDILAEVNVRRKRIWGKWDWKWTMEELATPVAPGTTRYAILALAGANVLVDRIKYLIPNDSSVVPAMVGDPLVQMEIGDFYAFCNSQTAIPSMPTRYVNIGQNAAGQWQVELWPSPSVAFTLGGFAKKILSTLTLADLTAGTSFDYFPDGVVEDVLLDGVNAGIRHVMGDDVGGDTLDAMFESKLKLLVAEQGGVARDNSPLRSPLPDAYTRRSRQRSKKGTGVY